jgi:hypothetical protein
MKVQINNQRLPQGVNIDQETPSEVVAKAAAETATAQDSKGRAITVHRLNALLYYRLTKAMGATASNAATMELAVIAASVKAIDDDEIMPPATEREVEHLMQRLDFHGLNAAGEALKQLGEKDGDSTEAAKN